jgi:hypothetical protein
LSDLPFGPVFAHVEPPQCPSIRVGTPVPVPGPEAGLYRPPNERR